MKFCNSKQLPTKNQCVRSGAAMIHDTGAMFTMIVDAQRAWVLGAITDQRFVDLCAEAGWAWIANRHALD